MNDLLNQDKVTLQLMMFLITKVNVFFILNYQQFYFGAPEFIESWWKQIWYRAVKCYLIKQDKNVSLMLVIN